MSDLAAAPVDDAAAPVDDAAAIVLDAPLSWREVAAVAAGAQLSLSSAARDRLARSRAVVDAIVTKGIRAYGVNTGVGALCDTVVDRPQQRRLSRSLVMSHAVGVGPLLDAEETRAVIAAQVNIHALGWSGVSPAVTEALVALLDAGCLPEVPAGGSVGYLTHMAHVGLVLIGAGHARLGGERLGGAEALARIGLAPLVLEAKDGLSLINGIPCATGLASVALARAERLLDWADAAASLTFESLGHQPVSFDAEPLALKRSEGIARTGSRLRAYLAGSAMLAERLGGKTQDALSLRAVPQVHGGVRDALEAAGAVIDRELASVSDNPAIAGTPEAPRIFSEAHGVGSGVALAMDGLATAVAQVAAMAERRLDRLVNPLVSGLPAFLAVDGGAESGFMIAQYTAASLVAENRRLSLPASLDGGVTSALQEDHLSHATPAAVKALAVIANAEHILGIELAAAAQAVDLHPTQAARAAGTTAIHGAVRAVVDVYADDRPLGDDLEAVRMIIRNGPPPGDPT